MPELDLQVLLVGVNGVLAWVGWGIKTELKYIAQGIGEAKESADLAHKRIDSILMKN